MPALNPEYLHIGRSVIHGMNERFSALCETTFSRVLFEFRSGLGFSLITIFPFKFKRRSERYHHLSMSFFEAAERDPLYRANDRGWLSVRRTTRVP